MTCSGCTQESSIKEYYCHNCYSEIYKRYEQKCADYNKLDAYCKKIGLDNEELKKENYGLKQVGLFDA